MKKNENHELQALDAVLGIFGAKPERWPPEQRDRLLALVQNDAQAAVHFAEAKAMDKLLDLAPAAEVDAELEARILAAAARMPQVRQGQVSASSQSLSNAASAHAVRVSRRWEWRAAALLAASLVLGVYLGLSGRAQPVMDGLNILAAAGEEVSVGLGGALFEPGSISGSGQGLL
jgi:hypothetical protein